MSGLTLCLGSFDCSFGKSMLQGSSVMHVFVIIHRIYIIHWIQVRVRHAKFFKIRYFHMLCSCLLGGSSAKFLQSTSTEGNYYFISSRSYFPKINGITIPLENPTGKGMAP